MNGCGAVTLLQIIFLFCERPVINQLCNQLRCSFEGEFNFQPLTPPSAIFGLTD